MSHGAGGISRNGFLKTSDRLAVIKGEQPVQPTRKPKLGVF
jgi:hypothetical protein